MDFTETFLNISVILEIIIDIILLICLIMFIILNKYYTFRTIIAPVIPSSVFVSIFTTIISIYSLLNDTKFRAIFYFVRIFKNFLCFIFILPFSLDEDND